MSDDRLLASQTRLRNAITDAILELDAEHRPEWYSPEMKAKGKDPIGCVICFPHDGHWPCSSAMIADDLRAIILADLMEAAQPTVMGAIADDLFTPNPFMPQEDNET